MNIFVKNSDQFVVEVFAWEVDGQIKATHDKQQVPKEIEEVETIGFTFRRPNFADTTAFMKQAQTGGAVTDVAGFQDLILRTLLTDWTIVENGNKVALKASSISKLSSPIALAATAGCLEKIF